MNKNTVRISFDLPVEEHTLYKTECVKSRIPIKDFMHNLVTIGMHEYKKAKFKEKLARSIEQSRNGQVRTVTLEELERWENDLENEEG